MLRIALRRLGISIPMLFIVSVLSFVLAALLPGSSAASILGPEATPDQISALQHQLGLDQPLWEQYRNWLSGAVRGDFGTSVITGQSVSGELDQHFGVTLMLIIGTVVLSVLLGVFLGVFSAVRGGKLAATIDWLSVVGLAVPNFWLALTLISVFAVALKWFPATGFVLSGTSLSDSMTSLVLPVVTLSAVGITGIAKQTRDAMLSVLKSEYVASLRGAGLGEVQIIWKHALRNAAAPIATQVGLFSVGLLGGTVLIEQIFVLPGLGGLAVSSAQQHDLPTLQAVVLLFTVVVVVMNLAVDLVVGWLNPRSRMEHSRARTH
jgi:peptide/nickel transport system permease protein